MVMPLQKPLTITSYSRKPGDELVAGVLNGLADHGAFQSRRFEIITTDDSGLHVIHSSKLLDDYQPLMT